MVYGIRADILKMVYKRRGAYPSQMDLVLFNEKIWVAYSQPPSHSCGGLGGGPFRPWWGALGDTLGIASLLVVYWDPQSRRRKD